MISYVFLFYLISYIAIILRIMLIFPYLNAILLTLTKEIYYSAPYKFIKKNQRYCKSAI